jgi:hypothetical protein
VVRLIPVRMMKVYVQYVWHITRIFTLGLIRWLPTAVFPKRQCQLYTMKAGNSLLEVWFNADLQYTQDTARCKNCMVIWIGASEFCSQSTDQLKYRSLRQCVRGKESDTVIHTSQRGLSGWADWIALLYLKHTLDGKALPGIALKDDYLINCSFRIPGHTVGVPGSSKLSFPHVIPFSTHTFRWSMTSQQG